MKRTLAIHLATATLCPAQDVLILKNGDRRAGDIASADENVIRLRVSLNADAPGTPPAPSSAMATVSIPRSDVVSIEFRSDPALEARLRTPSTTTIYELEAHWKKHEPWLPTARSPAGAIGCSFGNALLATGDSDKADRALELFTLIEEKSWSNEDKALAKQGRLRAMVATGRASEAIEQAKQLAVETEDPQILIEANYILAQAADKDLRDFLKENPRWDIDSNVIDQRHELYNKVLELYLYPALFFGSDNEKAARGLWGATGIYQASNQTRLALETSRDIVTFYPATPEAARAREYLATLTPDQLAQDSEAEARKELQDGITSSPAPPTDSATATNEPTSATKKSEKTKP